MRTDLIAKLKRYNLLSKREREVFKLIGAGLTSEQISQQLNMKSNTTDSHKANIKYKLHLDNGAQLTWCAVYYLLTVPNSLESKRKVEDESSRTQKP